MSDGVVTSLATCSEQEARVLTDSIRRSVECVWELLLEAYERRAWTALGYRTWEEYVRAEFDMSVRRAYQLVDQGFVLRELEQAAGVCTSVHITEAQARDIKGHLDEVAGSVREAIAEVEGVAVPEARVAEIVKDVVKRERERINSHKPSRGSRTLAAMPPLVEDEEELAPGEMEAILEELEEAHGDDLTDEIIAEAVEGNLGSKRTPQPLSKPDVGGGVSHPARYSDGLLPIFAEFLKPGWRVLDPFAGTGVIHQLRDLVDVKTTGIEIEPEWANLHPDTQVGSALDMPFDDEFFDAIVTSPTYGNRLADHHDAVDPESRRSYRHDLGRPLTADNSGSLQWGPKYRTFHESAWEEALRVLAPGGVFVLNIKDHIRAGKRQAVSAWHVRTLVDLGCAFVDCVPYPAPHLRSGSNADRVGAELVWVLTKEIGR